MENIKISRRMKKTKEDDDNDKSNEEEGKDKESGGKVFRFPNTLDIKSGWGKVDKRSLERFVESFEREFEVNSKRQNIVKT